jgi:hypothetical protein
MLPTSSANATMSAAIGSGPGANPERPSAVQPLIPHQPALGTVGKPGAMAVLPMTGQLFDPDRRPGDLSVRPEGSHIILYDARGKAYFRDFRRWEAGELPYRRRLRAFPRLPGFEPYGSRQTTDAVAPERTEEPELRREPALSAQ